MSSHLTPLEVCERLFGSIEAVAGVVGYHPKSAYAWRFGSSSREGGDIPSFKVARKLLEVSEQQSLGLSAWHILRGAPEEQIDEILRTREGSYAPMTEVAAE